MFKQYRKKPVVIEAALLTGKNAKELLPWIQADCVIGDGGDNVIIKTLEGDMRADIDDYIIRGVKGEFYPCKPDVFAATYDPV
jgi:hypothetical protein